MEDTLNVSQKDCGSVWAKLRVCVCLDDLQKE